VLTSGQRRRSLRHRAEAACEESVGGSDASEEAACEESVGGGKGNEVAPVTSTPDEQPEQEQTQPPPDRTWVEFDTGLRSYDPKVPPSEPGSNK
jgi:hypothetical protein